MFAVGFASRVNKKSRKSSFLPQVKFGDLSPLTIFIITRAKRLNTEFGEAIVIDLNNENCLFLPKRIVRKFDGEDGEEDFQELLTLIQQNKIGFRKTAEGLDEFVDL